MSKHGRLVTVARVVFISSTALQPQAGNRCINNVLTLFNERDKCRHINLVIVNTKNARISEKSRTFVGEIRDVSH